MPNKKADAKPLEFLDIIFKFLLFIDFTFSKVPSSELSSTRTISTFSIDLKISLIVFL